MNAKLKARFVCQQCGTSYPKWSGRCDNCGAWNSLVEEAAQAEKKTAVDRTSGKILQARSITDVSIEGTKLRIATGFSEVNDVLGGGLVPGGVVLLAGQPGIGKSTILMQLCLKIAS